MVSKQDIQNLADLARIEIQEEEIESTREKMEGILQYVSEVQSITSADDKALFEVPTLHNVFRKDGEPDTAGVYTDAILKNAPETEAGYIKVR